MLVWWNKSSITSVVGEEEHYVQTSWKARYTGWWTMDGGLSDADDTVKTRADWWSMFDLRFLLIRIWNSNDTAPILNVMCRLIKTLCLTFRVEYSSLFSLAYSLMFDQECVSAIVVHDVDQTTGRLFRPTQVQRAHSLPYVSWSFLWEDLVVRNTTETRVQFHTRQWRLGERAAEYGDDWALVYCVYGIQKTGGTQIDIIRYSLHKKWFIWRNVIS